MGRWEMQWNLVPYNCNQFDLAAYAAVMTLVSKMSIPPLPTEENNVPSIEIVSFKSFRAQWVWRY